MSYRLVRREIAACGVVAASCLFAPVAGAAVSWDQPAGTTSELTYSNGQTTNGQIGSPTVQADNFLFFPADLLARAEAGSTGQDTDGLQFDAVSVDATGFDSVSVVIDGNFAATLGGSVSQTATLRVTNLATSVQLSQPVFFDPTFPQLASNGSTYTGQTTLPLAPGWTNVQVVLDTQLDAGALFPDSAALIQTLGIGVQLNDGTPPVPEPTALALLAAPAWLLLGRRRQG